MPTDLGFIVTELMEQYFREIVDAGFTAQMEENLDDIEVKGIQWKSVIRDFYGTLKKELEVADKEIQKVEFEVELTGRTVRSVVNLWPSNTEDSDLSQHVRDILSARTQNLSSRL